MRKYALVFLLIFHAVTLYASDYYWDFINSLIYNDFRTTENIINQNIDSMTVQDKRLVMNFTLTYSHGSNTENVINLLINKNIIPNDLDLYTAVNMNQIDTVIQLLTQNGSRPNGEILLLAMEKRRFDLARQFIKAGVDVNYRYPLSRNYADGMTALLYACKWNNSEITRLLVENRADINAIAVDGSTALTLAETNGNVEIYNYLIEHGAAIIANNNPPAQSTGVSGIIDSQVSFQTGTYRFGSNSMRFSGTASSGSVSYVNMTNSRVLSSRAVLNGVFRTSANTLTISLEGYTFIYRVDSNESFSGNGEVWTRIGN